MLNLSQIKAGQSVTICDLRCNGSAKQRFIDLGIFKGQQVYVKGFAPLGDPMIIQIKDCQMAIRKSDAKELLIG